MAKAHAKHTGPEPKHTGGSLGHAAGSHARSGHEMAHSAPGPKHHSQYHQHAMGAKPMGKAMPSGQHAVEAYAPNDHDGDERNG